MAASPSTQFLKVSKSSFVFYDAGSRVVVKRGTIISDPKDTRYKGREKLFEDVSNTPRANQIPVRKVERATAEPGTQRAVQLPPASPEE